MIKVKEFSKFIKLIPDPPQGTVSILKNALKPSSEPKFDNHYELLETIENWFEYPNINPKNIHDETRVASSELGSWVGYCCLQWSRRYSSISKQADFLEAGSKGVLTSSLAGVFALFGLDGELSGDTEIGTTLANLLARAGVPLPLNSRSKKSSRNMEILNKIRGGIK